MLILNNGVGAIAVTSNAETRIEEIKAKLQGAK
jgi:hypothetical protein